MQRKPLFTIGHSNLTLGRFVERLQQVPASVLVDVRSRPYSRHNPQFNEPNLRQHLQQQGLQYQWAGHELGGLRQGSARTLHPALASESMQAYAEYMTSEAFQRAVGELINLAQGQVIAIMCAEREPLCCHRSLIADALILQGCEVRHIQGEGEPLPHHLRPEARVAGNRLFYDRHQNLVLDL